MYQRTEQEIMQNWEDDICRPIVSVCCTTYNHESYIAEAIDGFLMQETDFRFEILIRDDCSTDKTAQIVRRYAEQYPQLIKPVYEKENTFSKGVKPMPQLYKIAKGKYIALCEGDDYWIDTLKLQKQVDFLEENDEYVTCIHNSLNLDMDGIQSPQKFSQEDEERDYTLEDLFQRNITNTCTLLFKNKRIVLPHNFNTFPMGDWPLQMILAEDGKIKYFPEIMAVYRIHTCGIWSKTDYISRVKKTIFMLEGMNEYFSNKYKNEIYDTIGKYMLKLSQQYEDEQNVEKSIFYFEQANKYINIRTKDKLKFKIKTKYPQFYLIIKTLKNKV